jgi:hypothetical protein
VYGIYLSAIGCNNAVVLWCVGVPISITGCAQRVGSFTYQGQSVYSNVCFGARRHHALCVGLVLAVRMLAFGAILIVPARSVPEEPCVREF